MTRGPALVLLSGGQDSTTALYWARQQFASVLALTFDYGQKHVTEIDAARLIARLAGVEHTVMELPDVLPSSSISGHRIGQPAAEGGYAFTHSCHHLVTGNYETGSVYPDGRRAVLDSFETTWGMATHWPLRIHTPLMYLTKAETVHLAAALPGCMDAQAHSITSYNGTAPGAPGSDDPASMARAKGFADAGITDPGVQAWLGRNTAVPQ
jgi:7-cyano-7-deazaguanine synthase